MAKPLFYEVLIQHLCGSCCNLLTNLNYATPSRFIVSHFIDLKSVFGGQFNIN